VTKRDDRTLYSAMIVELQTRQRGGGDDNGNDMEYLSGDEKSGV